jgi:hypothetical protein
MNKNHEQKRISLYNQALTHEQRGLYSTQPALLYLVQLYNCLSQFVGVAL